MFPAMAVRYVQREVGMSLGGYVQGRGGYV